MELSESYRYADRYAEYLHINDLSTLTLVNIYFQNVLFSTYLFDYLEFAPEGYVNPKLDSELFLKWCLKHGIRLTGLSFYFGNSYDPPAVCLRNANRLLLLLIEYLNKNGKDLISLCIACDFKRDFGLLWFKNERIISLFKHIFAKCPNLIGLYIDWDELEFTLRETDTITILNSNEYKKQRKLRDFVFFDRSCPFVRSQKTLDAFVHSLVDKFDENGVCDLGLYAARHGFQGEQHTYQILKEFEEKNMFRFSIIGYRSPIKGDKRRLLLSECLGAFILKFPMLNRIALSSNWLRNLSVTNNRPGYGPQASNPLPITSANLRHLRSLAVWELTDELPAWSVLDNLCSLLAGRLTTLEVHCNLRDSHRLCGNDLRQIMGPILGYLPNLEYLDIGLIDYNVWSHGLLSNLHPSQRYYGGWTIDKQDQEISLAFQRYQGIITMAQFLRRVQNKTILTTLDISDLVPKLKVLYANGFLDEFSEGDIFRLHTNNRYAIEFSTSELK